MVVKNDEITRLVKEKHLLLNKIEKREIDVDEGYKQVNDVQNKINQLNRLVLDENKKQIMEEKKMSENEVIKKEEKIETPNVGKKVQKNSQASIIADALMLKTVKNVDAVIAKVKEKKPDAIDTKIKSQLKAIIRECKAGKGRWKNYSWNDEEFLLTEK